MPGMARHFLFRGNIPAVISTKVLISLALSNQVLRVLGGELNVWLTARKTNA